MQCRWRCISYPLLSFRQKISSTAPLVLRPYQEDCLDSCTKALASGTTRIGVSLPTGAGKTTVFISLISRIPTPAKNVNATRSLIVVNSIELARQSAAQVQRMFPEWVVEIEQGAKHQATGAADVTIATYQTLNNEQRLMKFDRARLKAIIIDEAHHAAAPSYRRLLSQFDSEIKHPDGLETTPPPHKIPIIGFSATFSRHDGLALGSIFESIVYHRDFLEMIKEEWLSDVRFTSVQATMNLENVSTKGRNGDFITSSLARVVNTDAINNLVVRSWIDRASERKSTLVFCVDINHVKSLTQAFRDHGVNARYIYAATPAAERQELVKSFKNGEFPVLLNCAILTEGADIPNIDCVVLARPTRSRNLFAQMIGRGMRLSLHTGKTDCRIIDFVDNNNRVGGAVSIPTLFGLDPRMTDADGTSYTIDIDDETPQSLAKRIVDIRESQDANSKPIGTPLSVTYEDFDSAFEMDENRSVKDPNIIDSPFAWVNCGDGIYVLELQHKGFLRVEPTGEGGLFKAGYSARNTDPNLFRKAPYLRTRSLLDGEGGTLTEAIGTCDAFIQLTLCRHPASQKIYHRFATWRSQPATEAQRRYITGRWLKHAHLATKVDSVYQMTKGQAATAFTRLRHGLIGRSKAKEKKAAKGEQLAAREASVRVRESVQVGPMAR